VSAAGPAKTTKGIAGAARTVKAKEAKAEEPRGLESEHAAAEAANPEKMPEPDNKSAAKQVNEAEPKADHAVAPKTAVKPGLKDVLEKTQRADPEARRQIDDYAHLRSEDVRPSMPIQPKEGVTVDNRVPSSAKELDPSNISPNFVSPGGYREIQFR